ncbi:hypothetical protein NQ314_001831 [Rhamnusium bicolor]|uniref:Uncharacterized protein n=1 Tax=Rhamnusium bicolor TaxID=1586634 RepID=A0AAV8ZRZ1_9CUCU|nr:hypothetical protein NQ314_001831 [Rhamnusium bicolor]
MSQKQPKNLNEGKSVAETDDEHNVEKQIQSETVIDHFNVIDGHKVVINETEYKKEDDFGGAFFKVRIIDVKPESGELTTNKDVEEVTTVPVPSVRDRESVENSVENEIFKSREATNFENIETFDEVDSVQPFGKSSTTNRDAEWSEVMPIEPFEDNALSFDEHIQPIDLSDDIRVNQIMADAGAPIDPDAEFIYDIRHPQNQHVKLSENLIKPR